MKITVLIPTLNRPDIIGDTITSILDNPYKDFELLIIDQSPDKKTNEIVEKYLLVDKRVRYLAMATAGKTKALNYGVSNCKTDIIAMTDDDCRISKDWIEKIAATFKDYPDLGLLFGSVTSVSYDVTKGIIHTYLPSGKRFFKLNSRFTNSGIGANIVVRENVFYAVGGFDEKLGAGNPITAYEYDFFYRVKKKGFAVGVLPSLKVVHCGLKRFEDLPELGIRGVIGQSAICCKYIRCGDLGGVYAFFRGLTSLYLRFAHHTLFGYKYFPFPKAVALIGLLFGVVYYALYGILLGLRYRIDREREVFI